MSEGKDDEEEVEGVKEGREERCKMWSVADSEGRK